MKNIKFFEHILLYCFCSIFFAIILSSCTKEKSQENLTPSETPSKHETTTSSELIPQNTSAETDLNEDEAMQSKISDLYSNLEDVTFNEDKRKQVNGAELKEVDFSGCSVAAVSDNCFISKIYEYLPEEKVKEFTDCIKNAEISSEEDENVPVYEGGQQISFQITLNTGEVMYIGKESNENTDLISINGKAFPCDKESAEKIAELYVEIEERFYDKARQQ